MDYISNREPQVKEMLSEIGVDSMDALFSTIPDVLLVKKVLEDDGLSELEVRQLAEVLAAKNRAPAFDSYLGAGAYEHYVPALVPAICGKSEFLTSYTPYQAEASQGMLQAMFEFQSALCTLTGLDVSNSSLYDGASACAEALLMAMRLQKGRLRIVIAGALHPLYRRVVDQYLHGHIEKGDIDLQTVPFLSDGSLSRSHLEQLVDENTVAVLIQSPNFFGVMEEIKEFSGIAHAHGALLIQCGNPLAYGLYSPPGEVGADIAVGDCQPFGNALNYGGPYAGYIVCKGEYVRQLPGRIVGQTEDAQGRTGYVLTLQTREQHIRREKATSNICTSQTLAALASLVAMLWYGKEGIYRLALTNFQRAAYLRDRLLQLPLFFSVGDAPHFNEFTIKVVCKDVEKLFSHFRKAGIEPGINLERFFPDLHHHLLIAVTEMKSKEQLDHFIATAEAFRE
jgi:glycine dehydrogenase subunit 1